MWLPGLTYCLGLEKRKKLQMRRWDLWRSVSLFPGRFQGLSHLASSEPRQQDCPPHLTAGHPGGPDGVGPSQSPLTDFTALAVLQQPCCLWGWSVCSFDWSWWDETWPTYSAERSLGHHQAQPLLGPSWQRCTCWELAPGKLEHSREETKLSARDTAGAHREDHAELTASERSSPVHGEGNRRRLYSSIGISLTAPSLRAVLWGHDCSSLALLFSTSQNKNNLKYWSWWTLSKFHKPMWGFFHLKYGRLLLSEDNLEIAFWSILRCCKCRVGLVRMPLSIWCLHFHALDPWEAAHPSSGKTLWTWSLMKAWGHGILSIQIQAHTSHLGARRGCEKLGCLSQCPGLWIWEQGPFLTQQNLHSLLHSSSPTCRESLLSLSLYVRA